MLKNDIWIKEMAQKGMITPFEPSLIRQVELGDRILPVISYGLSSYGYDIRLSPIEFFTFKHIPNTVINPKKFSPENLESTPLQEDEFGQFFVIPGNSYGLGVSVERFEIPPGITAIFLGKSTYARVGQVLNVTPAETCWKGSLTIEVSNSSPADCRIYCNEGISQMLFLEGEPCETSYEDRQGKYQNQPNKVVFARV